VTSDEDEVRPHLWGGGERITMCVCGLWRYNLKKTPKTRTHTRPWQRLCAPKRQEESELQIDRAKDSFERRGWRRGGIRAPWRAHIHARVDALTHTYNRYQFIIVFLFFFTRSKVLLNERAYSVESSFQSISSNSFLKTNQWFNSNLNVILIAKRMRLRCTDFRFKNVFGRKIRRRIDASLIASVSVSASMCECQCVGEGGKRRRKRNRESRQPSSSFLLSFFLSFLSGEYPP